jgi:hypothetical protein
MFFVFVPGRPFAHQKIRMKGELGQYFAVPLVVVSCAFYWSWTRLGFRVEGRRPRIVDMCVHRSLFLRLFVSCRPADTHLRRSLSLSLSRSLTACWGGGGLAFCTPSEERRWDGPHARYPILLIQVYRVRTRAQSIAIARTCEDKTCSATFFSPETHMHMHMHTY